MGTSCSLPKCKCYDNEEQKISIDTESNVIKDNNEISLDSFLLLIPDNIKKEMESEKAFFENQQNNSVIKTIKIKDNNSIDNKEIFYHGEFNENNEKNGIGKMIIMNENDEKIIYHGIWVKNQLKKGISKFNFSIPLKNKKIFYISLI